MGTQGQGICRRLVGTEESAEGSCCRDHARSDVLGLPDASIGYVDLATANAFSGKLLPDVLVGPWNGMVELGYTMALIGCVSALIRRLVFTPEKLKGKSQLEGNVILLLIFTITTTSFMIESKEDPSAFWEPIGYQFSLYGLSDSTVVAAYWLHMLAISVFLFLIPLSKHMHLVMAVPNVFFHDTGPAAKMRPLLPMSMA